MPNGKEDLMDLFKELARLSPGDWIAGIALALSSGCGVVALVLFFYMIGRW